VPWLESLCAATGGHLLRAGTDEQIRTAIRRIFWGLQYREEITYRLEDSTADQAPVRVQVCSDQGIAADSLPLE
jgi:hypothetical protein